MIHLLSACISDETGLVRDGTVSVFISVVPGTR